MDKLTLSFFGVFQATLGCKLLENFRSAKVQGLLIYLSLTPRRTHARDVLATLFWPDEPEVVAKLNLRQSLFRLRTVLGDGDADKDRRLLITRTTVQFNPVSNYSLDMADFSAALAEGALETAVSLYRGELLPGFSCDSVPFDDWLRQTREQYHRQALVALNQLTADSLSQGNFQTARQFAQQQLVLEPWREEAHRQLMQALASLGERTAALAQYETCRAILAEEFGVDPSPETINLVKRIREAHLERPAQQTADPTARQRLNIPFVGRQAEYETLIKAYQRARHHGLQLVTVQGQAGIGKTRLTEQFATWAATQGADVLIGRSFATSASLSYQPITHLLRLRLERENAPEDLLSDFWLSQLTRLLPELRERYPDLPEPTQEENTAREHLFEAFARLIGALAARKPLLLFVDDWHWADTASLDLLHYAAVRCSEEKLPILIVLTLRQEAIGESSELQSWLTKLRHATDTLALPLRELSQRDTEQLIQTLLEPETDHRNTPWPQFTEWLFAETDGQPLFLAETLKALVEDGLVQPNATTAPSASSTSLSRSGQAAWRIDWSKFAERGASGRVLHGVQEIIQGWLARIPPPAKELLTAVSVLAQQATFDHLRHVAGLGETQAIEALDDLLGKQLLQEADSALTLPHHDPVYSFFHQKVSEVDTQYQVSGTANPLPARIEGGSGHCVSDATGAASSETQVIGQATAWFWRGCRIHRVRPSVPTGVAQPFAPTTETARRGAKMVRIPTHRQPTPPGEMLLEEFLLPMGITQRQLADAIHVPYQRINEIVNGRRGITPATALRLAKFFEVSPDFWMNLQLRWDLYHAQQTESNDLMAIHPFRLAAHAAA